MISPMDHIDQVVHAELVGGIILPEAIRAFIHPVVPTLWRSPDEVAEAEEIHRMRRTNEEHGDD